MCTFCASLSVALLRIPCLMLHASTLFFSKWQGPLRAAQAGVELLDRKMATLRADINEKAAEAAKVPLLSCGVPYSLLPIAHSTVTGQWAFSSSQADLAVLALQVYKFNAGAAHPTADSSPETVAAGLAATAEVMQLNATLTHLAAQRGALVAAGVAPQFSTSVDQLQVHTCLLPWNTVCPSSSAQVGLMTGQVSSLMRLTSSCFCASHMPHRPLGHAMCAACLSAPAARASSSNPREELRMSALVPIGQEHSAEVGDSIAEVVRRLEITRTQKSEGDSYRGNHFSCHAGSQTVPQCCVTGACAVLVVI